MGSSKGADTTLSREGLCGRSGVECGVDLRLVPTPTREVGVRVLRGVKVIGAVLRCFTARADRLGVRSNFLTGVRRG